MRVNSRHVLGFWAFEVCSVVTCYTSLKVTFLKTVGQKSEFEHPCFVAEATEGGVLRRFILFCWQLDCRFSFT